MRDRHRRVLTSADDALAYTQTDEFRRRFEEAQRTMQKLAIKVTAGDAEMVAAWAEEGLKGEHNPVAREAVRRFRTAFNDAARDSPASPNKRKDQ